MAFSLQTYPESYFTQKGLIDKLASFIYATRVTQFIKVDYLAFIEVQKMFIISPFVKGAADIECGEGQVLVLVHTPAARRARRHAPNFQILDRVRSLMLLHRNHHNMSF